jgi:hypothetical protein
MKHPLTITILFALLLSTAPSSLVATQSTSNPGLDTLKSLAGDWTTTDASGEAFTSTFRVISNGTALEETVNSAHDKQMISIYNADGQRVSMSHFCSMGNQPRLETPAERPNANEFAFSFVSATNLADPNAQHMHRMLIAIEDADHFTETWTIRINGKDSTREFHYTRKK